MVTGRIDIFSVIFTNVVYLLPEYAYSYHINTDIEIAIGAIGHDHLSILTNFKSSSFLSVFAFSDFTLFKGRAFTLVLLQNTHSCSLFRL